MNTFNTIRTVATVEMRLLLRSRLFRIGAAIVAAVITFFHIIDIIAVLNPFVYFSLRDISFLFGRLMVIPASVPYENVILSTIGISIVLVLLAASSIRRERTMDTRAAIHVKEMTNTAYITGKAAGMLVPFIVLVFVIMVPALVYNITDPDTPVELIDYLIYPLLIALPAFVFLLGLSFLLATIVRYQAAVLGIVTLCMVLSLVTRDGYFSRLIDLFAFRMPLLRSTVTGLSDFDSILVQRSIYFLSGLFFLCLATWFFRRLSQSRISIALTLTTAAVMLAGSAVLVTLGIENYSYGQELRVAMRSLNEQAVTYPMVTPLRCDINLQHTNREIDCTVRLVVKNDRDILIDRYLFTLNPGLVVTSVTDKTGSLAHKRDIHHLWIDPRLPLSPDAIDTVTVSYRGRINEEACYLFATEAERWKPQRVRRNKLVRIPRCYAFIQKEMVLLTPEVHWYPVPGVQYIPSNPVYHQVHFTHYTLSVAVAGSLTPISQGIVKQVSKGQYRFVPEYPLTGISLIAGHYMHRSIVVDSIAYHCYNLQHYDIVEKYFSALGDTLSHLIRDVQNDNELDYDLPYPFHRFSLIEVPVQFSWHSNPLWTGGDVSFQPEMKLLHTRQIGWEGFFTKRSLVIEQMLRFRGKAMITPENVQSELFMECFRYFGFHQLFFTFAHHFTSLRFPVIGKAAESYIAARPLGLISYYYLDEMPSEKTYKRGELDVLERANITLGNSSLAELLQDTEKTARAATVLSIKGFDLFMQLEARLGSNAFKETINRILATHSFSVIPVDTLFEKLRRNHEFEMEPLIEKWYYADRLPGFTFSDVKLYEVVHGDRKMFNVRFTTSNPEPVPGLIEVGYIFKGETITHLVTVDARQTKELGIFLNNCPTRIKILTMISQNLPNRFIIQKNNFKFASGKDILDGERVLEGQLTVVEEGAIVVDNEDAGFTVHNRSRTRLLDLIPWFQQKEETETYVHFRMHTLPRRWTPTIDEMFYGRYVKSAYFIEAGKGENKVSWNAVLSESGWYDVYAYLVRMRWMREDHARKYYHQPYHFRISHDEGVDEVTPILYETKNGWNLLGRYYFSAGNAWIELSDNSTHGVLIADAVKWVRCK